MEEFKQHIASDCRSEISESLLNDIIARYEWFSAARVARAHLTGKEDSRLKLYLTERVVPLLSLHDIDIEQLLATPQPSPNDRRDAQEELIDKFLQLDNYRIVADEGDDTASDNEIRTEAEFEDEDDIVSEELAEVYLAQGLKSEAIAIYRKLSLLNPKKSIYFAELIEQIEKQ